MMYSTENQMNWPTAITVMVVALGVLAFFAFWFYLMSKDDV